MTYFRELPDVEYQNFLADTTGSQDYILMKNIFIRGKLRDDLRGVLTVYDQYAIKEDQRADQIAEDLYGDPGLDWVVIIVANLINYPNDYPLSSSQLYDYCVEKYGVENMLDIKNYETTEVRDERNNLILPGGLVVDKSFTIPNPDFPQLTLNPVSGVTYFEYEGRKNDAKKQIRVLRREYLGQFISDMRDISTYGFNSEYVNPKTIRVTNTLNTSP